MIKLNFKEFWTDHATDDPSPWSSQSNADVAFGATGAKSKYLRNNSTGRTLLNPEELYLHKNRAKIKGRKRKL